MPSQELQSDCATHSEELHERLLLRHRGARLRRLVELERLRRPPIKMLREERRAHDVLLHGAFLGRHLAQRDFER